MTKFTPFLPQFSVSTVKQLFILLAFFAAINVGSAQSCLPGGITFSSQADIDDFADNYPGCATITGNVIIGSLNSPSSSITSLDGLSGITAIGGTIYIQNNLNLTSLNGLHNINSIGGGLHVSGNFSLASLDGLASLTSIGDVLNIYQNRLITDLGGLAGISSLDGTVFIQGNQNLASLNGLHNLVSIGGELYISANFSLHNLVGLGNLASIGGGFYVFQNYSLSSFDGVENLLSVGGSLSISTNFSLASLSALKKLVSVGLSLDLVDNPMLSSLDGLDNIIFQNISPLIEFVIIDCPKLSFCGVQSVCTFLASGGEFIIENNANGCNTIQQISASCGNCIADTASLNDNPILDNTIMVVYDWIKSAGVIETGSKVSMQAQNYILLQPGFHAQNGSEVQLLIRDCPVSAATTTPQPVSPPASSLSIPENQLRIYPNPASDLVNIDYQLQTPQPVSLWVQAVNGQKSGNYLLRDVFREAGDWQMVINTSHLSPGMYVVFLETKQDRLVQKLLIVRN
ncbi:3-coathanger stack domain-containing protein [Flavilitoribacter nigricans]|uniref:Secretion system C-terminal sorting domain-containing protein n=1 Tax=Flavilitoribacter nigricans (strain ATCC 23147 / DSM 23189 / NBRC 102662 / NCIMB 1420 / SS-2) TaxID=1122177 RepID=A0A2D0N316_FLAN2|nr:3-coathanger stack domain-containing protein [Flavilitoribacter nigricans]PHN02894.1 hypothetical protein CRP01_29235 [Flavilitoribacter nigricans DSM 23189 = NBRC 102662]